MIRPRLGFARLVCVAQSHFCVAQGQKIAGNLIFKSIILHSFDHLDTLHLFVLAYYNVNKEQLTDCLPSGRYFLTLWRASVGSNMPNMPEQEREKVQISKSSSSSFCITILHTDQKQIVEIQKSFGLECLFMNNSGFKKYEWASQLTGTCVRGHAYPVFPQICALLYGDFKITTIIRVLCVGKCYYFFSIVYFKYFDLYKLVLH